MAAHQLSEDKCRELLDLARRWGTIAANEAYGETGPGLDVDLAGLEQIALLLQKGILQGFCEQATTEQARQLTETIPCPQCGEECEVPESPPQRPMTLTGGEFSLAEPQCYCRTCRRSFFPSADGAQD